jgi:hypothetical protein
MMHHYAWHRVEGDGPLRSSLELRTNRGRPEECVVIARVVPIDRGRPDNYRSFHIPILEDADCSVRIASPEQDEYRFLSGSESRAVARCEQVLRDLFIIKSWETVKEPPSCDR